MDTNAQTQETLDEFLALRYPNSLPEVHAELSETLHVALGHKSVRKFLDRPVTDNDLRLLVAAAQSASTSSSLQMWSVIAVRDQQKRSRIAQAIGASGKFIETAPVVLFWVIDYARAHSIMLEQGVEENTFDLLESTVIGFLDVGIASQNLLLTAESLGLGGVYAGSIRNDVHAVIEELGLPEFTFPVVGMALGYPDPAEGTGVKPRLPQDAVLHFERYDPEAWREATAQHDQAFAEYYAAQGKPGQSWLRTMTKRLSTVAALGGRERLREFMTEQGLGGR